MNVSESQCINVKRLWLTDCAQGDTIIENVLAAKHYFLGFKIKIVAVDDVVLFTRTIACRKMPL